MTVSAALLFAVLLASAEQLPPCSPKATQLVSSETLSVTVFRGTGVDLSDVERATQDAGRPLGVRVRVVADHVFPVDTLLTAVDLPAGGNNTLEPLVNTALKPVKDFLREHGSGDGTVHLVLVRRLVAKDAALARYFSSMEGLTFSPLLEHALPPESPTAQLHRALGLPRFNPTVFLGVDELRTALPFTTAHELGHALGLPHVDNVDNLMSPQRRAGCEPALDGAQRTRITQALKGMHP